MGILPSHMLDELCNELLSLIEIDEAKLLNWGFFDVRSDLSANTLTEYLTRLPPEWQSRWKEAQFQGYVAESLLKNLTDRRLIFQLTTTGQQFYRTRFAETIRLLFLLKQRFTMNDWQTASRLVSDLKIMLQRRLYPRRDVDAEEILQELRTLKVSKLYLDAIKRLLQSSSGTFLQLARFQKEAILQVTRNIHLPGERAITIGAGTGSGKTKAFYLPALAEIASTLSPDQQKRWVQVLALYPRTELLKDQLQEAFSEARKLDHLLARKITVAAYYGDTPRSASSFLNHPLENWQQNATNDGWICPFISCPQCHSQELTWYRKDLEREKSANQKGNYEGTYARLYCPNPQCRTEITHQQLLLTREQIIHHPPDLLFTTTEMLNRCLSRTGEHHLFGVSTTHQPPRLVLLDEIHTYEGTHGAQIAYLLRRWRHARRIHHRTGLCIVGLSATLANAEAFFAKLTGVPIYHINAITPREQDLIEENLEYNIVLKGDPVSGTSLLSTSVQTIMLLGRMLDLDTTPSERVAYGKKIFAFADKLDVLNRWYHIEQEAEVQRTLSQLRDGRSVIRDTRRKMYLLGQDWMVCQNIGHDLRTPLRLELTSSQYRGVNAQANFILATSTLEVGFNDPDVGMVVQHKAPRSMASFLQRKGRAGRQRHMRPWMVVVTSAYGRDRWAFQHTEQLFHPQLSELHLPIDNYYVRKIQATYALMDWLAYVVASEKKRSDIDIWKAFSSSDRGTSSDLQPQRYLLRQILEELLRGQRLKQFQSYLSQALGISQDDILLSLLWGDPRSLLFEVIPTLIRQLATNWQSVINTNTKPWTDTISNNPMPDFMPPTLFSDLNVAETVLHIPERLVPIKTQTQKPSSVAMREDEYLSLIQALNEFAPGHVNKRYSRKTLIREAHWLKLPDENDLQGGTLPLNLLNIECDEVAKRVIVDQTEYAVYQPRAYILDIIPSDVKNSSNGHLVWRSHFAPKQVKLPSLSSSGTNPISQLSLTSHSPWKPVFSCIECYTQTNGYWVEITRLATGVATETFFKNKDDVRRKLMFIKYEKPAALGFTIYADALRFEFVPLDTNHLFTLSIWPKLYQHLGPDYFLHRLEHDVRLDQLLTSFEINWLWQLELSMLVAVAVAQQLTLSEAAEVVQADRIAIAERALKVIFQSLQKDDQDDEEQAGRLHKKLLTYVGNPLIQQILREHEHVLWDKNDPGLPQWVQQCYASSLGSTLFAAIIQLLPDINTESLILDVGGTSIWISEETGGGIGLISRIADALALHPGEFDLQMQDILEHCDREHLAGQLQAIAHLIEQSDSTLAQTFVILRQGTDLPQQLQTKQALMHILEQHGIAATRDLIVALNAKFLRPNSSADSDLLIADLVRIWQQEEQRIGCTIDLRVMAVAALRMEDIKAQVKQLLERIGGPSTKVNEPQVFNLLQSLLWFTCKDSCPDCIQTTQPYQRLVRPSRSLLIALHLPQKQPITYGGPSWEQQLQQIITTDYYVQLSCQQEQLEMCKQELLHLLTIPIEIGYQLYYPIVERFMRDEQHWIIKLCIRELMYG